MKNLRLYEAVLTAARKAAERPGALNEMDKAPLAVDRPDPKIIGSLLLKMRKRGSLRPVDLTNLRLAVKAQTSDAHGFGRDFEAALAETWMENEIKKDTPRKW